MLLKEIREIKSTVKELREFGFVVGGFILVVSGIHYWRHGDIAWAWPAAGAVLLAVAVIFPSVLKPLQKIWMTIALLLGWVMSRVILTLMFFVIVTPIALILRAQGKRFMDRSGDEKTGSYWKVRDAGSDDPKRCEHQY